MRSFLPRAIRLTHSLSCFAQKNTVLSKSSLRLKAKKVGQLTTPEHSTTSHYTTPHHTTSRTCSWSTRHVQLFDIDWLQTTANPPTPPAPLPPSLPRPQSFIVQPRSQAMSRMTGRSDRIAARRAMMQVLGDSRTRLSLKIDTLCKYAYVA